MIWQIVKKQGLLLWRNPGAITIINRPPRSFNRDFRYSTEQHDGRSGSRN